MAARQQSSRVLVTGETTESTLTYINPDGTITLEAASGPVRVKQGDRWTPIDTTLTVHGGVLKPKASIADVKFSAGGDGEPLAVLDRPGGQSYMLTWPTALPKPKVEGNKATYPDAAGPGADLVLTALATGFRHDVVLRQRPTGPVEYEIPLRTEGLTITKTSSGGLALKDAKGKTVAAAPRPIMFGSQSAQATAAETTAASTDHPDRGAVSLAIRQADDGRRLILRPDPAFLTDPGTVYPVTVDPTVTLTSQATNTINSTCPNGDQFVAWGASVGVTNYVCPSNWGAKVIERALLGFDTSSLAGQQITDAQVQLTGDLWGCPLNQKLQVRRITRAWNDSDVFWSTQPTTTDDGEVTVSPPSICTANSSPASDVPWAVTVTAIAQAWASGAGSHGLLLKVSNEEKTQPVFSWDFTSSEAPKLVVTYGSTPIVEHPRAVPVASPTRPIQPEVGEEPQISGRLFTTTTTPTLSVGVRGTSSNLRGEFEVEHDPNIPAQGSGLIWSGVSTDTQPGEVANITVPAGNISDGWRIRWRARATDGSTNSAWTQWQLLGVDATRPQPPVVYCNRPYLEGSWGPHTDDGVSCTFESGVRDVTEYLWALDDTSKYNVMEAGHWEMSLGETRSNKFAVEDGWHTLYVKTRDKAHNTSDVTTYSFGAGPGGLVTAQSQNRTQRYLTLDAAAHPGRTEITYEYNTGSALEWEWATIPSNDVHVPGTTQPISNWPQTRADTSKNFSPLSWDITKTLHDAGLDDRLVYVRACFSGGDVVYDCSAHVMITLEDSAFGKSYGTAEIGPGKLALQTGDFAVDSSDVSLFGMEVSRTHTSLYPQAERVDEQLGETQVFGPGWRAGFPSAPSGVADFSPAGGGSSVYLVGADGTTLSYVKKGTSYRGVGDAADGSRITATDEELVHTDTDGNRTTYTKINGRWLVTRAETAAEESAVTYYRDGQGRITRILAPVPDGVTCETTLAAGCRALELSYGASTTATGVASGWGDYKNQVKNVSFTAFDPETNTVKSTVVAAYLYDSTGHLRQATDPRSNLGTVYYYNGEGRLSQITPAGLSPWLIEYDNRGRLAHVQREGGDVDPTQAITYDVPIGGTDAPVNLIEAETARWGQVTNPPIIGTAMFPASHVPARHTDGTYRPTNADWEYAQLAYLDVNGRVVNGASFGAGTWQVSAVSHDDKGNAVWELSPDNLAQALTPTSNTDPYVASRTDSAERANLLARTRIFNDDSDLLSGEDQARQVVLADGTQVSARPRTTVSYDEGKPTNDKAYHLVTSSKTEPVVLDGVAVPGPADIDETKTGYEPIRSGDPSGWDLRLPTSGTTVMPDQEDITTRIRYDTAGREVERRTPKSTGADAGTTTFMYYTAGPHPSVTACGNKPGWAGLKCRTGPADQPAGKPLPTTMITYSYLGQQASSTDTSGSVIRTSTTEFDAAGRPVGGTLTVTPESEGGHSVPEVTYTYDPNTGLRTQASSGGVAIQQQYDSFGRIVSVTDADSNTSTMTYTVDGKIATLNDGKGTTTYTYNGADAVGRIERRGIPTKIEASSVGAFTAAYDAGGRIAVQTYPNGLSATYEYDNTGKQVGLAYAKDNMPWLRFSSKSNADGLTVVNNGPNGSNQRYTYDAHGRLTAVADTYAGTCVTRTYEFDLNTNRSSLTTQGPDSSGGCSSSTDPIVESYSYDAADRITNAGYAYDDLGRTRTIPASHVGGGSQLQVEYYANDMVASLTQDGQARAFVLDPLGRIRTMTKTGNSSPQTMVNHYAGEADSPAWIAEPDGTWTRNIVAFTGLAAIQKSDGTSSLQLVNLHGDIVATCDNSAAATSITSYFEQTEYGIARAENTSNPQRYGWIGNQQRSVDALAGLVLMGARLYNPVTGRFLQVDPVLSGSANRYDYCSADPINCYDVAGKAECGFWCELIKGGIAAIVAGVFGAVCAAFTAGVGAVLCAVVAGGVGAAVDYLAETYMTGEPFSWSKFRDKAVGGLVNGLIGGSAGAAFIKSAAGKKFGQAIVGALNEIGHKISNLFGSKYGRFFTWIGAQLAIVLGGAGWACGADMRSC
ncbi:DNRLRE domain-containing protein [Nonomuraea sp. B1E8]|uniref:DNRLRE domain-containing protein n=1 Tax=unclassified Nonomuraea TaxID=2593643 RepID=UPI00325F11EE